MKKKIILTDIMKTGHHWWYAQFLKYNSILDQTIEVCDDYYRLNDIKLDKFYRKIALICVMNDNLLNNIEYKEDLIKRIKILKDKNFKFVVAFPWESKETSKNNNHIKFLSSITKYIWYGETNWFWFYMFEKNHNKQFNFNHSVKKHDFLYLNKLPRSHRVQLFKRLEASHLLDNSLYSFLSEGKRLNPQYELPWVDTNNYPEYGSDQDIYENPYNDSYISIVSETSDSNLEIFITEKIWKPIIAEHIFVVHGNYRCLKKLKEMGFKTFENIFSERYDEESDSYIRRRTIVNLLNDIKLKKFKNFYKETADIRKHNKDLFWNKAELSDSINQTILGFFKFFDSSQISS